MRCRCDANLHSSRVSITPPRSPFAESTLPDDQKGNVRPDANRETDDEALTPARGTGDETIDPEPIWLVLVEPRAIQGAAVREMLEREDDFEVVAMVRTTEEAADFSADEAPDILVVDVDLPDPAAVEATRQLRRQAPDSALVIIGRDADDEAVLRAVQAGASADVADEVVLASSSTQSVAWPKARTR